MSPITLLSNLTVLNLSNNNISSIKCKYLSVTLAFTVKRINHILLSVHIKQVSVESYVNLQVKQLSCICKKFNEFLLRNNRECMSSSISSGLLELLT